MQLSITEFEDFGWEPEMIWLKPVESKEPRLQYNRYLRWEHLKPTGVDPSKEASPASSGVPHRLTHIGDYEVHIRKEEIALEIYLTIITTVLVLTQVIRITQNTISLHRTNKVIKAQLGQIEAVGDSEVKRRIEVDSLLIELLPALIARYVDGEDDDEC